MQIMDILGIIRYFQNGKGYLRVSIAIFLFTWLYWRLVVTVCHYFLLKDCVGFCSCDTSHITARRVVVLHLLENISRFNSYRGQNVEHRLSFSPGISHGSNETIQEIYIYIFCYKSCLCCLNAFTRTEILHTLVPRLWFLFTLMPDFKWIYTGTDYFSRSCPSVKESVTFNMFCSVPLFLHRRH